MAHPFAPAPPSEDDSLIPLDRPHDGLFRFVFARPSHAGSALRALLPAAVASRIDWTSVRVEPGTFVDAAFARAESDLLFSVDLDGSEAFLYLLFEHQSRVDPTMNVRLVGYAAHIWKRWLDQGNSLDQGLPPILPVVLAHAEQPWSAPTRLGDSYRLPDAHRRVFGRFLFDLEPIVLDLTTMLPERLLGSDALTDLARLALATLKLARSSADLAADLIPFAATVAALAKDGRGTGRRDLAAVFRYIRAVSPSPTEKLQDALRLHAGPEAEEVFVTSAQQLIAQGRLEGRAEGRVEGRAEGRLEGRAEGRAEARAATLLRQLERKFGPVDPPTRARVAAASSEELDAFLDRILFAERLEGVFAPEA